MSELRKTIDIYNVLACPKSGVARLNYDGTPDINGMQKAMSKKKINWEKIDELHGNKVKWKDIMKIMDIKVSQSSLITRYMQRQKQKSTKSS